ncbi:MAG TPA: DUF6282 family protein [Acidimicrobiales bacterium]|nr:DUF6282 family protein [Acidimicrobiales bacterium]
MDLTGAIDLHCHFGPDAHFGRSVTAVEAARDAVQAGHAAVLLKSHSDSTAAVARAVDQMVDGVQVFGGICCDREVGGLNPSAVEVALRLGAKIVWLPTLTSRQDEQRGLMARLGLRGPAVDVSDDAGRLLPETNEVLDLVAEAGAVLATGHVSARDHLGVVRAFARRGRVLVTHAMEELAGPALSVQDCVELAELGAVVELCAMTCLGHFASRTVADIAACAREIGPARCTLGTDYGQAVNPRPAAGFQAFADALVEEGLREQDVRRMACDNPRQLLGI